jgi:hypothetical protein
VFSGAHDKKEGKNGAVIETVGKRCGVGGDFVVLHFRAHNEKLNGNKKIGPCRRYWSHLLIHRRRRAPEEEVITVAVPGVASHRGRRGGAAGFATVLLLHSSFTVNVEHRRNI